jgi:predicted small metal-binding protein
MRVMECNECGETLQAANDEELVRCVSTHMESEHHMDVDAEDMTELVEAEAYEAMDS